MAIQNTSTASGNSVAATQTAAHLQAMETAMVKAKEIVRRQLSKETDELQDKLDKMLDF